MSLAERLEFATGLARRAGSFAHEKFAAFDQLVVESKGHQDPVSDADRATEVLIREAIAVHWPDDGIVGEEYARVSGSTGFDWVIDPIDGTANYIRGIPHWATVIACTTGGLPVVGAIFDPSTGEMFSAAAGHGAFVNGRPMRASGAQSLTEGAVGTGINGRTDRGRAAAFYTALIGAGGIPFSSASGALMLAYVAAGRLLGYAEAHMNSWDCFAALLMLEEAGGMHRPLDPETALDRGTPVIAGGVAIQPLLEELAGRSYG